MDRVTRFNVIAMSGKAVEACGDVDTMILDKTGTITYGNRLAADFYPVGGAKREELIRCAAPVSYTHLYNIAPSIATDFRDELDKVRTDVQRFCSIA